VCGIFLCFVAKPVQISSVSQSIPKERSPRVFDFMRFFSSSLTSRKSPNNEESTNKDNSLEDCSRVTLVHAAKSVTPTSSDGGATSNNKLIQKLFLPLLTISFVNFRYKVRIGH
jgi:hypothetical protein